LFDRRGGMLRTSLETVDTDALHRAIRAGLLNEDGRARSAVGNIYEALPFDSLKPLLPAIHEATMKPSPSGIMFADGVRMAGLRLLAKHNIKEGIAACVHYVRYQKPHASEKRTPEVLEILMGYGAHGQSHVEELEAIADYFENDEPDFPKRLSLGKAKAVREAIEFIKESTERPELMRIE
ncbi:MAG: acetylesterase, partial [Planctomycetota bacterium]